MKKISGIIMIAFVFASCSKSLSVDTPELNVSLTNARSTVADTLVYKLGDTCKFALSGYVGNIAFYPGTVGFEYKNRERVTAEGTPRLQFTSYLQWGSQVNTLKILATSNLDKVDSATVVNAAWTDITSRATLSTGTDNTPSGIINLADVAVAGKPLYIAFKYTGTTGSVQHTWTFKNLTITNLLPTGNAITVADLNTVAFTSYGNVWSPASSKWLATTAQLQIVGGAATAPDNTSWAVSKALKLNEIAPDISISLKSIGTANITSYNYKYATVGTYTASILAFNNSADESSAILKEFFIKIIP